MPPSDLSFDWDWMWAKFVGLLRQAQPERNDYGQTYYSLTPINDDFCRLLYDEATRQGKAHHEYKQVKKMLEPIAANVFWECFRRGLISPRLNPLALRANEMWINETRIQFFITPYGRRFLSTFSTYSYDMAKYLENLASQVPELNDNEDGRAVRDFVSESLRAFESLCDRAAMVMLGCAAEKLMLTVMDSFQRRFPGKPRSYEKERVYARKKDKFIQTLKSEPDVVPAELCDKLDRQIGPVSEMIRMQRNDAGHPTLGDFSHEDLLPQFGSFPSFCKACFELMRYWNQGN
jgi:hypothetical protein